MVKIIPIFSLKSIPNFDPHVMKYVTFGFSHKHFFNKDTIAILRSESPDKGREFAFRLFGFKFCFEYPHKHFERRLNYRFYSRMKLIDFKYTYEEYKKSLEE